MNAVVAELARGRIMTTYKYTIFDSDPASSGSCAWPDYTDVAIECEPDELTSDVNDAIEIACAGLNESDGYEVGQKIYAYVWDESGQIVASPTYTLTAEDLNDQNRTA